MRILLIEDDAFKADDVKSFVDDYYNRSIIMDMVDSYSGGVTKAAMIEYDLLIVDMTLPKYTESNGAKNGVLPTGGEILLETLNEMGICIKSVVLTQYETFNEETIEDIHNRLVKDCGASYLGYIKYDYTAEEWKNKLIDKIEYAFNPNHR